MPQIIVMGALGRVGREIARFVFDDPGLKLAGCVEVAGHPDIGREYASCTGCGDPGLVIVDSVSDIPLNDDTVIIDFTSPESTMNLLETLKGRKSMLVIGTTGCGDKEITRIETYAEKNPVVFSPNMSMGVNLLFHITQLVARRLAGEFDVEIIEAHHRHKKDSPSGTAKKLGEIVAAVLNQPYNEIVRNGREGMVGERSSGEIGMHAIRGGDIVGDHTVLFAGSGERIELRHMAHSRRTFAQGAVVAARWLAGKPAGLYSMKDILGI